MRRTSRIKVGEPPITGLVVPHRRLCFTLYVALLFALALASGGATADPASAEASVRLAIGVEHAGTSATFASRVSAPERLRIPAIHVNAPFMRLGLQRDGSLQVPPNAFTAGWFIGGPNPGQLGPAIVAAHVHWNGRPGVFEHLGDLRYDDRIIVTRKDGSSAVFRVTRVSRFTKNHFPTNLVYGNINHRGLRLITCDGFNYSSHTYLKNVVVFAMLVTVHKREFSPTH
jgi:sortase (surface protein transpeptidase)